MIYATIIVVAVSLQFIEKQRWEHLKDNCGVARVDRFNAVYRK
jgi:hypothetical protein